MKLLFLLLGIGYLVSLGTVLHQGNELAAAHQREKELVSADARLKASEDKLIAADTELKAANTKLEAAQKTLVAADSELKISCGALVQIVHRLTN